MENVRKINLKNKTKYAIEKSKEIRNMHREDKGECTIETSLAYDMQYVEEYIKQLENEVNKTDIEKLCDECSSKAKECGFTKEDSDRIIAETREMERKAEKYDLLVEKLEEDVKTEREFMKGLIHNSRAFHYANGRETKVQEILSFMEEE